MPFTNFRKLPIELQLKIWTIAIIDIGPRIVHIVGLKNFKHNAASTFEAKTKPPLLLSVCHDSRIEALKRYSLMFHDVLVHPTYFDVNVDVFYMGSILDLVYFVRLHREEGSSHISPRELTNVRTLALGTGSSQNYHPPAPLVQSMIERAVSVFLRLDEFVLLFPNGYLYEYTPHVPDKVWQDYMWESRAHRKVDTSAKWPTFTSLTMMELESRK